MWRGCSRAGGTQTGLLGAGSELLVVGLGFAVPAGRALGAGAYRV